MTTTVQVNKIKLIASEGDVLQIRGNIPQIVNEIRHSTNTTSEPPSPTRKTHQACAARMLGLPVTS